MKTDPKLIVALLVAITFALYVTLGSPHKKYSSQQFWSTATPADVERVPDKALQPGNRHGPVLMWAAMATDDPNVIAALVERGADVNESDSSMFSGTPLSGAAARNRNPAIIDELVRLGADVHKTVGSEDKTALIIAAEVNPEPAVIEALIRNGSDPNYRDSTGRNALEQAMVFDNTAVLALLKTHVDARRSRRKR